MADDFSSSRQSLAMHGITNDQEDELLTEDGFPKLSAPARRALAAAGYTRLEQIAEASESDIKKLHGMGPTAIAALRTALGERGLSFRS